MDNILRWLRQCNKSQSFRQPFFKLILGRLRTSFHANPMLYKGLITGSLYSVADLFAQIVVEGKETVDRTRNINFLIMGLFWEAPIIQLWYSKILPGITSRFLHGFEFRRRMALRVMIDALFFAPTGHAGFYLFKTVLEHREHTSMAHVYQEIRQKLFKTVVADWILWVPANLFNFVYVPIGYQSLFVGVLTFFFNIVLSFIAFDEPNQPPISQKDNDPSDTPLISSLQ